MIYEKNNEYYIKKDNVYYLVDIVLKKHTIVVMPTSEYVSELLDATEYSFQKLKNKFIGGND